MDKFAEFTTSTVQTAAVNNIVELPSVGALFFRILVSLLLIIFIVYFVLKIINQQQKLKDNQKKWVKILDYQPLGPTRGLYLMEMYGNICIVAVSDGHINILKEIDHNTTKWKEIKDNLQQFDEIVPSGISKFLKSKFPLRKKTEGFNENYFQQQLAEQFRKSQHLSQEITRGGKSDE